MELILTVTQLGCLVGSITVKLILTVTHLAACRVNYCGVNTECYSPKLPVGPITVELILTVTDLDCLWS